MNKIPPNRQIKNDIQEILRSSETLLKKLKAPVDVKNYNQIEKEFIHNNGIVFSILDKHTHILSRKNNLSLNKDVISAIEQIEFLYNVAKEALADISATDYGYKPNFDMSLKCWLIGDKLPKIYKSHFSKAWGYTCSPDDGEPHGPAINFTQACLKKIEASTYSPGSIVQHYKRYKRHKKSAA